MEQNDWNVEKSFERLFESAHADAAPVPAQAAPRQQAEPAVRRRRRSPSRRGTEARQPNAPAPVRPLGWLDWAWRWIALPWHILLHVFHLLMGRPQPAPPEEPFSEFFEKHFGEDHPLFFPGQFREALNDARLRFRPVIVYLHSPRQVASQRFCTEVLADPAVMDFLDENFVLWAADVTRGAGVPLPPQSFHLFFSLPILAFYFDPPGMTIASNLGADGFPFIAGAIYNYGPGGSVFMMKLNQFVGPGKSKATKTLCVSFFSPRLLTVQLSCWSS